ncbi:MAG: ABC transporter permease [Anaerolineaceae bacterium]|nr:ABC transporter permease [Anaerolineaceae bacterium]
MKNKWTHINERLLAINSLPVFWLAAFFILPILIMIFFTFRETSFGQNFEFTLENYKTYLNSPEYSYLLWKSVILSLIISILTIILAYPIAYFLVFHAGENRMLLLAFLILPAWISYLLRILAWKIILGSNGLLNNLINSHGISGLEMSNLLFNQRAVIITLISVWIPFAMLPIFSSLERIEKRLIEASQDLGASTFQTFAKVVFPLSLPGLGAGFFFVFIPTLGEWVTPALMGGVNGIMFGNLIQDQFLRSLNWPFGAVLSFVLLIMVLVLVFFFSRFISILDDVRVF